MCTLRSEARPPDEAFNPKVKRSGWKAPEDTGLWDTANEVKDQASTVHSDSSIALKPASRALAFSPPALPILPCNLTLMICSRCTKGVFGNPHGVPGMYLSRASVTVAGSVHVRALSARR